MKEVETRERTFIAAAALAANLRVKDNGSGKLTLCDATDVGFGVTRHDVFAADDKITVACWNMQGSVNMVASAAITKHAMVYGAASGKISSSANANAVGFALEAASGNNSIIEVLPLLGPITVSVGVIRSATDASAAVSNTTAETAFDNSAAIAANSVVAGSVIRVVMQGTATATNSTDTLTIKLKMGSVTIVTSAAVNATDGDIFMITADIVIRTIGASGTLVACGTVSNGVIGTIAALPFLKASATIDTTAAMDITATATWSVASASNSCRMDVLNVEHKLPSA